MTAYAPPEIDPSPRWLSELRACVALSWPLVLTNAIEMGMNLTNVAMIGRVGPQALAAATLAIALNSLFLLFGIGLTAAVAPLIARQIGLGGPSGEALRRIVHQGFWGVAIIIGPIWIVLWNGQAIFLALGQEPDLAATAGGYLHALQWGLLPALLYLVLRSLFAAMERPRWAVVTGAASILLNAALNWLLIFGHGGFPALGLFGSGLATLFSNIFMAGALGAVAMLDPQFRALRVFSGLSRPPWVGFSDFWRLGLPIAVSLLLETGMFAAAAALIGHFGAASLAAHAIALQTASLTFMVPLGIAQAATVRIGRASGAGDHVAVALAGWTALSLGITVMAVAAIGLVTLPEPVIGWFLDAGEPGAAAVRDVAVVLLGLAGLFQIADGAQVVAAGMLRGLQDTRVPMVISAVGYWGIGLPLGALLAFGFHLAAPGVWIGMTVGLFIVAGLLLARWRHKLRRPAPRPAHSGRGFEVRPLFDSEP